MKQNRVLIIASIALLLTVFSLVSLLHYASRKEVVSRFQEQQLLHAHHVAEQIETFFQGYALVLKAFSTPVSLRHESVKQLRLDLQAYSQEMEKNSVTKISLYDASGSTIYSTDEATVGLNDGRDEFFVWCRDPGNKNKVFVLPLVQGAQNNEAGRGSAPDRQPRRLHFLLAVPMYDEVIAREVPKRNENFLGVLSFTVELQPFLINQLSDTPMTLHDAWIIEQNGMVLYYPVHPEMASRNIYQSDKSCNQCHDSFDYVKAILEKKEGTIAFAMNTSIKRLAGFAPVEFGNASWIVVMDSEDDRVTDFIQRSLRNHLTLLGIVVLALGVSSLLVNRNYQSKVKAEEEARHLQDKLAERKKAEEVLKTSEERLRFLSSQILSAQEDERKRISRELHDEVGPALATLKLRLGLIGKMAKENQDEIREECQQTLEYLDQMIENIRRFSRDLSPSALEHFGLFVALRRLLKDFAKHYTIEVSIDIIDDIDRFFSQDSQTIIYRIFQEVAHNVGKHAGATRFSVSAARNNGTVSFTLEDNGRGFDKNAVALRDAHRQGLGLDILGERVRMLGGMLDLWSEEGKGTRITIRIPVAEGGDT